MTTTHAAPAAAQDGRSLKLFELSAEYAALKALLDADIDGFQDTNEERDAVQPLAEALGLLTGAIEQKATNIALVVRQQEAEADYMEREAELFEREAQRIRLRAEAKRTGAGRLREYLSIQLAALGDETQKFTSPLVAVTLSKRPEKDAVVVTDESALPPQYARATLTMLYADVPQHLRDLICRTEIAKDRINRAYEETGVLPPGCETRPGTRRMVIK